MYNDLPYTGGGALAMTGAAVLIGAAGALRRWLNRK